MIFAPCSIRRFVPWARGSSIFPGTAKTSLPCSRAKSAVISDPLVNVASITRTAHDNPLMMRLRAGKLNATGGVAIGNSDTTQPCSAICLKRSVFSKG